MLYLSIKSFVNPFVNISSTFTGGSSSFFFLTSKCLVLFKVNFLLIFLNFSSKQFLTKSVTSPLVANFAFSSLAVNLSAVK